MQHTLHVIPTAASQKGHADLDEIDRDEDAAAADDDDAAAAAPASYHEEAAAAKAAFLSALDENHATPAAAASAAAADDNWFVAKAKSAGQSQVEADEAKAFVAGLKATAPPPAQTFSRQECSASTFVLTCTKSFVCRC